MKNVISKRSIALRGSLLGLVAIAMLTVTGCAASTSEPSGTSEDAAREAYTRVQAEKAAERSGDATPARYLDKTNGGFCAYNDSGELILCCRWGATGGAVCS
jgi:hypothetical protein